MDKKMILGLSLLFLAGFVAGALTAGQILTQQQINNATAQTVRANVDCVSDVIIIEGTQVHFFISCFSINQNTEGEYVVSRASIPVSFLRKDLRECINDNGLTYCKVQEIKPELIQSSQDRIRNEWNKVQSYQTDEDNFTLEDLQGIVTDEELN